MAKRCGSSSIKDIVLIIQEEEKKQKNKKQKNKNKKQKNKNTKTKDKKIMVQNSIKNKRLETGNNVSLHTIRKCWYQNK